MVRLWGCRREEATNSFPKHYLKEGVGKPWKINNSDKIYFYLAIGDILYFTVKVHWECSHRKAGRSKMKADDLPRNKRDGLVDSILTLVGSHGDCKCGCLEYVLNTHFEPTRNEPLWKSGSPQHTDDLAKHNLPFTWQWTLGMLRLEP